MTQPAKPTATFASSGTSARSSGLAPARVVPGIIPISAADASVVLSLDMGLSDQVPEGMLAYRSRGERHAGGRQTRGDLGQELIARGPARAGFGAGFGISRRSTAGPLSGVSVRSATPFGLL
jgi:hypothetical protein